MRSSRFPQGPRLTPARFRGSDDDLRSRFEEYISGALSALKYAEFKAQGEAQDLSIVGVGESLRGFQDCEPLADPMT